MTSWLHLHVKIKVVYPMTLSLSPSKKSFQIIMASKVHLSLIKISFPTTSFKTNPSLIKTLLLSKKSKIIHSLTFMPFMIKNLKTTLSKYQTHPFPKMRHLPPLDTQMIFLQNKSLLLQTYLQMIKLQLSSLDSMTMTIKIVSTLTWKHQQNPLNLIFYKITPKISNMSMKIRDPINQDHPLLSNQALLQMMRFQVTVSTNTMMGQHLASKMKNTHCKQNLSEHAVSRKRTRHTRARNSRTSIVSGKSQTSRSWLSFSQQI